MNVLTQIRNTQEASKREIELGISGSASWHDVRALYCTCPASPRCQTHPYLTALRCFPVSGFWLPPAEVSALAPLE